MYRCSLVGHVHQVPSSRIARVLSVNYPSGMKGSFVVECNLVPKEEEGERTEEGEGGGVNLIPRGVYSHDW